MREVILAASLALVACAPVDNVAIRDANVAIGDANVALRDAVEQMEQGKWVLVDVAPFGEFEGLESDGQHMAVVSSLNGRGALAVWCSEHKPQETTLMIGGFRDVGDFWSVTVKVSFAPIGGVEFLTRSKMFSRTDPVGSSIPLLLTHQGASSFEYDGRSLEFPADDGGVIDQMLIACGSVS